MIKNIFLAGMLFIIINFESYSQWEQQTIPTGINILLDIDFLNDSFGIAGGYGGFFSGRCIYTTNGGASWNNSIIPDSSRVLVHVQLINDSTGFAAAAFDRSSEKKENTDRSVDFSFNKDKLHLFPYAKIGYMENQETGAFILKTTDAGESWFVISVLPDSLTYAYGAFFIDETTGFLLAPSEYNVKILKTTDGGISWNIKHDVPPNSALTNIIFSTPLNGAAAGYILDPLSESGIIAVTSDGGETWINQIIPQIGAFHGLTFSNDNIFYAVSQNLFEVNIFKSEDYGQSWIQLPENIDNILVNGINFKRGSNAGIIYGGALTSPPGPVVFKTVDGGISWTESLVIPDLNSFMFFGSDIINENKVYIAGGSDSAIVYVNESAALPVGYEQKNNYYFYLDQNYPNPFNPSTRINYSISTAGVIQIIVYDIAGREIRTLVDEYKEPGNYQTEFNAAGLPSGVYICRISAGNYLGTKKMILLR